MAATFASGGTLTLRASSTGINESHVGDAWLPCFSVVEDVGPDFDRRLNTGEPDHDDHRRDQVLATAI